MILILTLPAFISISENMVSIVANDTNVFLQDMSPQNSQTEVKTP
jgi:hypothetical protein